MNEGAYSILVSQKDVIKIHSNENNMQSIMIYCV